MNRLHREEAKSPQMEPRERERRSTRRTPVYTEESDESGS